MRLAYVVAFLATCFVARGAAFSSRFLCKFTHFTNLVSAFALCSDEPALKGAAALIALVMCATYWFTRIAFGPAALYGTYEPLWCDDFIEHTFIPLMVARLCWNDTPASRRVYRLLILGWAIMVCVFDMPYPVFRKHPFLFCLFTGGALMASSFDKKI